MSLNQAELTLKDSTSESRTPVFVYQFDPMEIVNEKKLKLPTYITFLFFSIMERIRKKVKVTEHPTKIFSQQDNTEAISTISCRVFDL